LPGKFRVVHYPFFTSFLLTRRGARPLPIFPRAPYIRLTWTREEPGSRSLSPSPPHSPFLGFRPFTPFPFFAVTPTRSLRLPRRFFCRSFFLFLNSLVNFVYDLDPHCKRGQTALPFLDVGACGLYNGIYIPLLPFDASASAVPFATFS